MPEDENVLQTAEAEFERRKLTTRKPDRFGWYGIPDAEYATAYTKGEIKKFLLAIMAYDYDLNRVSFFRPVCTENLIRI